MQYAICRAKKIKTWSQIKAASEHHTRSRETPNADPTRTPTNEILVGSGDPAADLQQRLEASGAHYRSNSVKGIDMLLTASPEYFQGQGQGKPEAWNMKATEAFKKRALEWAQDYFGGKNVVSAILHLDESTPHLALMVTPIDETPRAKGPQVRLNAKKWMDGGNKLAKMQDSFAEAVKGLGLERGIKYSKAKHSTISKYYGLINKNSVEKIPSLTVHIPNLWSVLTRKGRQEFALKESSRLKKNVLPVVSNIRNQANIAVLSNKKMREYQSTAKNKEEENLLLKKKLVDAEMNYKQLADSLRDIDLQSVAHALELQQDYSYLYCNEACKIKIENNKFYDYYFKKGGGGAIDFVKHVLDCDFKQAISFLNEKFGTDETVKAVNVYQRERSKNVVNNASKERKPFVLPEASDRDWSKVRHYLIKKRGIESNIVDKLHEDGLIYAYRYKGHVNALFVNQSKDFAEKRGIESKFQGLLPSCNMGKGGLRLTKGKNPNKLVLVESAIDAMSYYQLNKNSNDNFIVMSAGGARPEAKYVDKAIAAGWKVYCAYDNDKAGDDAFKSMKEKHPQIERERPDPAVKDWNELLDPKQGREPELEPEPELELR